MAKKQCQAMDMHGVRCRSTRNVRVVRYHGDGEIYPQYDADPKEPSWVKVWLCERHRTRETKPRPPKSGEGA